MNDSHNTVNEKASTPKNILKLSNVCFVMFLTLRGVDFPNAASARIYVSNQPTECSFVHSVQQTVCVCVLFFFLIN